MVTLGICICVFYSYSAKIVRERTAEELSRSAQTTLAQLDEMVRNMDQLSLQIVSTQTLANQFTALCSAVEARNVVDIQKQSSEISQTLYATVGAWSYNQPQINLISSKGDFIGTSNQAVYQKLDESALQDAEWLQKALQSEGTAYLTGIHAPLYSRGGSDGFSLIRPLRIGTTTVDAILEIQQSTAFLDNAMEDRYKGSDILPVIVNQEGDVLYARNISEQDLTELFAQAAAKAGKTITLPENDERYIFVSVQSAQSGWKLITLEAEKTYLAPLSKLKMLVLGLAVLLLALTLILSYQSAQKIARPIRNMHTHLNEMDLTSLEIDTASTSELNELEMLNAAFGSACKRLENLLDELVASRSCEIQARMLALESQVNPHFLYNTIALLHAVADEHGDTDIVEMCEDLSQMLRYSLRAAQGFVSIGEELEYTESYLRLMKRRFEQNLQYQIELDSSVSDMPLPRMSIQPLVENCFKHNPSNPPWYIRITVQAIADGWQVKVEDNGIGFTEECRHSLEKKLDTAIHSAPQIKLPEGPGIGLLNIGLRLYLSFKEQGTMQFGVSELGGAMVTICGGKESLIHDQAV